MENKQDKGFTLVELLIVIVILGILATVTVFAVRGITDQGKQNACATERKTILTATEAFYAQNGVAPAADFTNLVPRFLTDSAVSLNANWTLSPGSATTAATVVPKTLVVAGVTPKCATMTP